MQSLVRLSINVKVTPTPEDFTGEFLAAETQQYITGFIKSVVEHFEFVWPLYKFEIEVTN